MNAHLLFSSRSQRSYVSKTLREELTLPTIRTENLKIKVFGNDKFKSEKVDTVPLFLVGNEKLVTIEVICYPMICSELNNQDIFCANIFIYIFTNICKVYRKQTILIMETKRLTY